MDERAELVNKVSEMILKYESDIKNIKKLVNEYDGLFDNSLRNFYEIKEDSEVPLFELCEYLRNGRDNYDMSEEEFKSHIIYLLGEIDNIFNVELEYSKIV